MENWRFRAAEQLQELALAFDERNAQLEIEADRSRKWEEAARLAAAEVEAKERELRAMEEELELQVRVLFERGQFRVISCCLSSFLSYFSPCRFHVPNHFDVA